MRIRRHALLFSFVAFSVTCIFPALAGGLPRPDLPDAQQLIKSCKDTFETDLESSDPSHRQKGYDKAAGCLEDTIMDQLSLLGFGEHFHSRAESRQNLTDIRFASRRLYSMIYTDRGDCPGSCGKTQADLPFQRHISVLEETLRYLIRIAAFHTGQWERLPPPTPRVPVTPDSAFSSSTKSPTPATIIDGCWAISLEDRSSDNARIRDGHLKTVLCLREKILELRDSFKTGETTISRSQTEQELDRLSFAVQELYWTINNDNDFCGMSCGTIWFSLHLPPVSDIYSDMIRVMIAEAAKHEGRGLGKLRGASP